MNHTETETLQPQFGRAQRIALIVGVIALVLCAVGAYVSWVQFLRSYLIAYFFWLEIALGCTGIVMLHHMVGGHWGYIIRRPLEAGASTLPLMALLFIPLVFGHAKLYQPLPATSFTGIYLGTRFFFARALIYFIAWVIVSSLLIKWSSDQDRTGARNLKDRLTHLSGPGILILGFTVTFASVDWAMSLEHGFFSTIYGMIYIIIGPLCALSFVVIVTMFLSKYKPLSEVVTPRYFNDHGNLLLAFTMLWAYLSFDQFLIVWSGNLQDEIPWYTVRARGEWGGIALALVILNFAVPFLLLLQRTITRKVKALSVVAVILFVISWVDMYWIIDPAFYPKAPQFHWLDFLVPIGLGGIWMAFFVGKLKSRPLLPLHDPRFEGALNHE